MKQVKLCLSDYKFMSVVWENEPIQSGELVKKCFDVLGWKKSTTYTMLKKLAEKGYLQNENSIVSSVVSQNEVHSDESYDAAVEEINEEKDIDFIISKKTTQKMDEK